MSDSQLSRCSLVESEVYSGLGIAWEFVKRVSIDLGGEVEVEDGSFGLVGANLGVDEGDEEEEKVVIHIRKE